MIRDKEYYRNYMKEYRQRKIDNTKRLLRWQINREELKEMSEKDFFTEYDFKYINKINNERNTRYN